MYDCLNQAVIDYTTGSCQYFIDYGDDNPLYYFGYPGDIETPWGNQGNIESNGYDISVAYGADLNMGAVTGYTVNFDSTVYDAYEASALGSPVKDYAGTADGFAVYPELRYNLALGLVGDNWTATWNMRYVSESDDVWRSPVVTADAVAEEITYHDIVATYDYGNATFRLGINNVTDEQPPYFHTDPSGGDVSQGRTRPLYGYRRSTVGVTSEMEHSYTVYTTDSAKRTTAYSVSGAKNIGSSNVNVVAAVASLDV